MTPSHDTPTRRSATLTSTLRSMAWVGTALIGVAASLEALRHTITTPIDRIAQVPHADEGMWIDASLESPRPLHGHASHDAEHHTGANAELAADTPGAHDGDRRALVLDLDAAFSGGESAANPVTGIAPVDRFWNEGIDGRTFGRAGTVCHQALSRDWDGDGLTDVILALSSTLALRDQHEVMWLRAIGAPDDRSYERGRTLVAWSSGRATQDDFVVLRDGDLPPTGARWFVDVRDTNGDGRADLLVHDDFNGVLVLEQEVRRSAALRERLDRVQRARTELELFWNEEEPDAPSASRERRLERLQRELDDAEEALDAVDPRRAGPDTDAGDEADGSAGTTWVLERTGR